MKKIFVALLCVAAFTFGCKSSVEVENPRVELQENPEGIGTPNPRFMWQIESEQSDVVQTSYQIEVATSPEALKKGDLVWNSGEVASDNSLFIAYEGSPLESGKSYFWRVRVNTNKGQTPWSEVQHWSMALLQNSDWKAQWIGIEGATNPGEELGDPNAKQGIWTRLAARYLRKEFESPAKAVRAMLYIGAGGSMEGYLNGKRISEDVFANVPTFADSMVYYNTYDVTKLMDLGCNTLAIKLGNGRFFPMRNPGIRGFGVPRLIAQLQVEYEDGTTKTIVTDTTWQATAHGPIIANNEFDGEEYDARLEMPGWDRCGFKGEGWMAAQQLEAPKGKLVAQPTPNIRVMEKIKPVSIKALGDSAYLLDMGQNMVGWLQVKLKGVAGQPIRMHFAELLKEDGSIFTANLRSAKTTDIYIPAKDGEFEWQPSFTYHGFRFVEIKGLNYAPKVEDFTGVVIYDKMETIGKFETSNAVINQVYKNAYWGIRGNYRGMPTDCPQRDERLGWLGDRTTGALGESFIFENALLYNKWLQDISDSRNEAGNISDVSPRAWSVYNNNITWPAAYFYVANMLYRQFGDKSGIVKHYDAMRKWMLFARDNFMKDSVIIADCYGDWCMPPESPELIHAKDPARKTYPEILGSTMYYSLLQLMSQYAVMTGHDADATEYNKMAADLKQAYNRRFFNYETAQYGNNTVTGNILSLRLGLVPEGYQGRVFENIVAKTEGECKSHVSTGVLGIQHLMRGLTEYGNPDLAFKIASNDTYPSWGYMAKKGATTIWELWNGDTGAPDMNSANHVMLLGDLVIWFYENLAGIANDPSSAGFKKILMHPVFISGLDYVKASYESVSGEIKSEWKREDGKIKWEIEIPANTTAHIQLDQISEMTFEKNAGATNIQIADGKASADLCSGKYEVKLIPAK